MYEAMTYEAILSRMLDAVSSSLDKREGSIIYDALAPAAMELAQCYQELDFVMQETFADTASRPYLIKRCAERGISPKDATAAIIQGDFTPDTLEMVGKRFNLDDLNFKVVGLIEGGAYQLRCETPGAIGNVSSGTLLPLEYIDGLQTATATALLIPGEDEEETEALRKRYFDDVASQPYGGNQSDYRFKVNALDGVGGSKIYPAWNGGGTVKVVIIDSEYRAPSESLVALVQEQMDPTQNQGAGIGIAPIGHVVTVVGAENVTVDIATTLTYRDGYNYEAARASVEAVLDGYYAEIATGWEIDDLSVVRVSQIESRLLDCIEILDIQNTSINGVQANFVLDGSQLPVRGCFPMARKHLPEYLPGYLREVREFAAIMNADEEEIDTLQAAADHVLNNQFINDATEDGIARYEEAYSVARLPLAALDERRFAILSKINEQTPYTYRALCAQLAFLCGEDGYACTLNHNAYSIVVKLELTQKNKFTVVVEMLERMLPCNLRRTVDLLYNQYKLIGQFTHEELSLYRHTDLRNEVI